MAFSSLTFLTGFLPLYILGLFLSPGRWKNVLLLLGSLLFYAWGCLEWFWLLFAECVVGYMGGLWLERAAEKQKGIRLFLLCAVVVTLLAGFKNARLISLALWEVDFLKRIDLPVGISFYSFQILSYWIDLRAGKVKAQHSFFRFALYICMFFQLVAGPIVRYEQMDRQLYNHPFSWDNFSVGFGRFICGLSKKVLLANPLFALAQNIELAPEMSLAAGWLRALALSLFVYYDFSGYTDMAVGLGRMAGYWLPENFAYPFLARSFSQFWRRWHMTLTEWLKDYVYIPLGGSRHGIGRQMLAAGTVWALTGLWHGAQLTYLVWGLSFFGLIVMEKFVWPGWVQNSWLYRSVVVLVLMISFVLFMDPSLIQFGLDFQILFGMSNLPLVDSWFWMTARGSVVLLCIAVAGCTPWPKRWFDSLNEQSISGQLLSLGLQAAALIVCIGYLCSQSWNPFLYFQF